MKHFINLLLIALFIWCCGTDKAKHEPAEDYMSEQYRPQFHFSPPTNWMNDPNGMVYLDGEYHLFYQHYPDSNVWGPMHWGHAISKDLIHWENLPIALFPDSLGLIFSGSCVIDKTNSTGFGTIENPAMVAIFTQHLMEGEKAGRHDFQTQSLAYSLDKGRIWTMFKDNPVIKNPGKHDFRDPKVFWHEPSKQWVMILAVKDHVELYGSADLKSWNFLSEFGLGQGTHGGVWECPDLFPLALEGNEKWVMIVSIGDGAVNGGSGTQYFIGKFDGQKFTNGNPPETILWMDYGRDNYAGVTWSNVPKEDGRRLFIGWMSNWKYATIVPTTAWRSATTVPRDLTLADTKSGLRVASTPAMELSSLRGAPNDISSLLTKSDTLSKSVDISLSSEIIINANWDKPETGFEIVFSDESGDKLLLGFDGNSNSLYMDRSKTGNTNFSSDFSGRHDANRVKVDKNIELRILIDASSIEIFADDGTLVMTELFFSTTPLDSFKVRSKGGTEIESATIYPIQSIWKK